jgi:hypothetical protein
VFGGCLGMPQVHLGPQLHMGPQMGLGMGVGMRQSGYLGLPWVASEVDIERRAAAAAAAADPYRARGRGYSDDYEDAVSSWGTW